MNDTSRRLLGFFLGAIAGLAYSLVSQYINVIYLPGVPLLEPDPGRGATVLLTTLAGGVLGLIASWPEDAIPGILMSVLAGTLVLSLLAVWDTVPGTQRAASTIIVLFITFLPRTFLLLPFAAMLRWSQGLWSAELQNPRFSFAKLGLNLLLIVGLSAGAGMFSLYSEAGRAALARMQQLLQEGMQATSSADLPVELKPVDGFLQNGRGAYTLELTDDPDRLPIQRAITSYDQEVYGIFIRYENGYRFGCVFTPDAPAACSWY